MSVFYQNKRHFLSILCAKVGETWGNLWKPKIKVALFYLQIEGYLGVVVCYLWKKAPLF